MNHEIDKLPCHKCGLPLFAESAVVTFKVIDGSLVQVYYHFGCFKKEARKQLRRRMRG